MCSFISLKSDLFKRVFFFMQGSVLLSVHHRSAPAPLLLPFGLSRWRSTRPAALSLVRGGGRVAAPSSSVASSCPLLPPTPPQLSAGLSPCRHVASALSQQGSCLWCGRARALSAVPFLWCWITLGPARSLH